MFSELLLVGCLIGVFYGAKKADDYRATHPKKERRQKTPPTPAQEETKPYNQEDEAVARVCKAFGCRFSAEKVRFFASPDYNTAYEVAGCTYVGYQTLTRKKYGSDEKTSGFKCDRLDRYHDAYHGNVIRLCQDIPCFDSGDREYDSSHSLYFFHCGGMNHALYCGEGYRVASLTLFENIMPKSLRLIKELAANGFPLSS